METNSKAYAQLFWSLLVATAIVVGLTLVAERSSSAPRGMLDLPGVTGEPVFVELRVPAADATVYRLPEGATLGDLFSVANLPPPPEVDVNRPIRSGEVVTANAQGRLSFRVMPGSRLLVLGLKIPLESANVSDLEAVPGIGKVLARRILTHVTLSERVESIRELRSVKGVGPRMLEKLRRYTRL
ncbi:MAG: helix-hairpin-helix domain-containing protein [Deltaproteobacteria bacterium]|nr:helix-hairpin-helix domain-containing protein [Deltaproteobacteria bacterium]